MKKDEIKEEIAELVEELNEDSKRFYLEYEDKFCGDEDVEDMIEDYAHNEVVRLQVWQDYPVLYTIRNLRLELDEVATWNVIK